MRILFAFNGSKAESEPVPLVQLVPCNLLRTCGTDEEIVSVPQVDSAKASNDEVFDPAGRYGQLGHVEAEVKSINTSIKLETKELTVPFLKPIIEKHVAPTESSYADSDEFDIVQYRKMIELNTNLVNCETCIHFDFLATPTSQSCMISAAKPHKRYSRKALPDIVAECDRREVNHLVSNNDNQNKEWNHETDYPF